VWASETDFDGYLKKDRESGAYVGRYPEGRVVANTTVSWAGKDWAMLLYPLPSDQRERKVLLVHESWHRVQRDLGLNMPEAFNAHLDTLDGRYWLQLEWRALAKALEKSGEERQVWVAYAIAARAFRQSLFPGAVGDERNLELNEGLAEYTGVRAAGAREMVIRELKRAKPPYARSFAYLTGPAYGLLLDDISPGWSLRVRRGTDLAVLLQEAYEMPAPLERDAKRAAERLGGAELLRHETTEEQRRKRHIDEIRNLYVLGPTLKIPQGFRLQFNPSNTENIEGVGVYHHTATYFGDWGTLEVTGGSLRMQDWSEARVVAPSATSATRGLRGARPSTKGRVTGLGWVLDMVPGWSIAQGEDSSYFIQSDE
jgi:hypothetical protein